MNVLLCLFCGALFAAALFLLLRRSLTRVVLGIALLSQAANLSVFLMTGLDSKTPAIIPGSETVLASGAADPLPQALVLTAIVIGFGIIAYVLMLFKLTYRLLGSDDLQTFTRTDEL